MKGEGRGEGGGEGEIRWIMNDFGGDRGRGGGGGWRGRGGGGWVGGLSRGVRGHFGVFFGGAFVMRAKIGVHVSGFLLKRWAALFEKTIFN